MIEKGAATAERGRVKASPGPFGNLTGAPFGHPAKAKATATAKAKQQAATSATAGGKG